jgi:hypothetical protein
MTSHMADHTVHVVDDNSVVVEKVEHALREQRPDIDMRRWTSLREVADAISEPRFPKKRPAVNDVAICDLFNIQERAESRFRSYPLDSPEGIKAAAMKAAEIYVPQLVQSGIKTIIFTYVFYSLVDEYHDDASAEQLRNALFKAGVSRDDIFEKVDKSNPPKWQLAEVTSRALVRLDEIHGT